MRLTSAVFLLLLPLSVRAQTPEIEAAVKEKLATLKYVQSLYDAESGAYKVDPDAKPSYRACNGAAKAIHYLGGELPAKEKAAAFILKCYDPATGEFAEPGGKADVGSTSVGVITAVEFGIPKEKFPKAIEYLKANAKGFEDLRIAAAAVEAWGLKDSPFSIDDFREVEQTHVKQISTDAENGGARELGSAIAMSLRLGVRMGQQESKMLLDQLRLGQREDGGWGKKDTKGSDQESVYRVMRALMLMKQKPADPAKFRAFVAKCRNADGGYGVEPGQKSNMSGTYYAVTTLHWLAELEGK